MAYELFFDGFETYSAIGDLNKFGYTSIPPILSASSGRRGGKALQLNANTSLQRTISNSTHCVLAAAINVGAGPGATFELRNGTTVHAAVSFIANQQPTLSVGGVSVGSAPTVFPLSTYMFVELGVMIGQAGIGTYEVRVNGSSVGWFPATVAGTQNGATTVVNNIRIQSPGGSGSLLLDDLYATFGDELNWLGDSRVDRLLLSSNTATQDFTPSSGNAWERLNAGDGYVESATSGATSLFEVADLPYNPLLIHGVKVAGTIRKSDAGYREACILAKSGSTTAESQSLTLSTDPLALAMLLKQNPNTGLPWDLSAIQALQAGVRVKV